MNVGKFLAAAALLLLQNGTNACSCQSRPALCEGADIADAVMRAELVSRTDTEDDSSKANTVFKVVEVFKSEVGEDQYVVDEEIQVYSPGSTSSCVKFSLFGSGYLVDLHRRDDGLYTGIECGIGRPWVVLTGDEIESLRTCTCDGSCDELQECLPSESSPDGELTDYYCADVCLSPPCEDPALVDAGQKTTVTQVASAYDTRISSDGGCDPSGCTADLTRDGSQDGGSRWSCSKQLDGSQCTITYGFDNPQDIVRLDVSFWKGDERTRKLKVTGSGGFYQIIESSGATSDFESFEINTDETAWLTLEAQGLGNTGWISIQEVRFMVA